jgi:adenosine deaminase
VFVTINTDDPQMFGTTLDDEYRRVAATFGLDAPAVAALVRNGITASFLAEARKRELIAEVDAALVSATSQSPGNT